MNCEHCLYYCSTKIEDIGLCSQNLDYSKQASLVDSDKQACSRFIDRLNALNINKHHQIFTS